MKRLGIKSIKFSGEKLAFNIPVLGKRFSGVVVIAVTSSGEVALKIRRIDADQDSLLHEAEMLRKTNTVEVGPRLINYSKNFLSMELIKGSLFSRWIETLKGGAKFRIRRVVRDVLEQCWILDKTGLDHGELSRASKHIVIDARDRPYILDFEGASTARRVSNVTSICQYLFIGSKEAEKVKGRIGDIDKTELINVLRGYKQERSQKNFEEILKVCSLQSKA